MTDESIQAQILLSRQYLLTSGDKETHSTGGELKK